MKRRKLFFIALAVALPLALIVPLRAVRSWQPRVLELPHHIYADTTEFFWRTNGLTWAKNNVGAPPLSIYNRDGALVSVRALPAQSAGLDRSGKDTARLYTPGGGSARIELWDVERGQIRRAATAQLRARNAGKNYLSSASCVAMAPDGTRVAWPGLKPYGVIVADTRNGGEIARFVVPTRDTNGPVEAREVIALAWSSDQRQLAVAGSTYVAIVDAATGKLRHWWRKPERYAQRLAWSPDGQTLALAWGRGPTIYTDGYNGGPQTPVFLWVHDAQTGQLRRSWSQSVASGGQAQGITNLDFSPDGKSLAFGTFEGDAHLMNLRTGAIERHFPTPGAKSLADPAHYVAYSPDGQTLAVATQSKITLWRVK